MVLLEARELKGHTTTNSFVVTREVFKEGKEGANELDCIKIMIIPYRGLRR